MNRHTWYHSCLALTKPCVNVSRNLLVVFSIAFQKLRRLLVNLHTRLNKEDKKGFNSRNLILQGFFLFSFFGFVLVYFLMAPLFFFFFLSHRNTLLWI